MTETIIVAPCKGWIRSLAEVPDPAFAEGMVGEGLAIDPLEGEMVAPCAGTVTAIAPSTHSVTLRTPAGIDLLLHIGIDTVTLAGTGFVCAVEPGMQVKQGDLLITFDPDIVAASATSLVTPLVITSPAATITMTARPGLVQRGDPLFTVSARSPAPQPSAMDNGETVSRAFRLELPHGLHARPAAKIVRVARQFNATIQLEAGGNTAPAASLSGLLALGVGTDQEIRITAQGSDAVAAMMALEQLFATGFEEQAEQTDSAMRPSAQLAILSPSQVGGVKASPGVAVGLVFRIDDTDICLEQTGGDAEIEAAALDQALAAVVRELEQRSTYSVGAASDIVLAHRDILIDDRLLEAARALIEAGQSAAASWRAVCRAQEATLLASDNARLAARAADFRDVERQVLRTLAGGEHGPRQELPAGPSIIVADELLPSTFLELDLSRVAGICTARGGATSHVAILAASRGLPMLVALGADASQFSDGMPVILDADAGYLETRPTDAQLAAVALRAELNAENAQRDVRAAMADCVMADGTRIEVFANLASLADAQAAMAAGAEGCGLLRTEILFLERETAPDEGTQAAVYGAVAAALNGRPLIIRTLDIGGDKPLAYLPFPPEENPALGARGIRHSLANPDLLETQLRAILRSVPAPQCRIMLPMVIEVGELHAVRQIIERLCRDLGLAGRVPLGVMIETPAAAIMADSLAREADFLSVGSNDLTQYTLAMDRGNPQLAQRADAYHPAVLRLIAEGARGATQHGRWYGICGGLASDPEAAGLLIGLGVTELSVAPHIIPAIKARIRGLTRADCISLAGQALTASSAAEVRQLLQKVQL